MRSKTVSEGVAAGGFGNSRGANGELYGVLQIFLMDMMPALFPATRINGDSFGRKNVLPDPFAGGVRVFKVKGVGQVNCAATMGEVLPMDFLDAGKVSLKQADEAVGQNGNAFAHAFPFAHGDLAISEVDIFDPSRRHSSRRKPLPYRRWAMSR